MAAIADQRLTVLADWKQEPVLIRAQRDFLSVTQEANEQLLKEILEAVGSNRSSLLRLPLTASELEAFTKLAELVPAGWQAGSEIIEENLIGAFADHPSLAVHVLSSSLQTFVTAEDIFVPPPRQFTAQYRRRELRLAGIYEADRLKWVQGVVARSQVRGVSPADMQATIGRRFPDWTNARLHNIARTESALLYEHGRVGRMQTSEFVVGYRYNAVLDDRTTDICASHDEQVYTKADAPVPPLHFQCRSNLDPIFAGESFVPGEPTQVELENPPMKGFGGGLNIEIVQPAIALPEPQRLPRQIEGVGSVPFEEMGIQGQKLDDLFDINNIDEAPFVTKERISRDISQRLAGNTTWDDAILRWRDEVDVAVASQDIGIRNPDNPLWIGLKKRGAQTTDSETAVAGLIGRWAGTSGDESPWAIALQRAVQRELPDLAGDATLKHISKKVLREANALLTTEGPAVRAFVREMYNNTQDYLEREGIDYVLAYRGARFSKPPMAMVKGALTTGDQAISMQPASSFSTNLETTFTFATPILDQYGMVSAARVPRKRVLSTCQTGLGCKSEAEIVVLGGDDVSSVVAWATNDISYKRSTNSIINALEEQFAE